MSSSQSIVPPRGLVLVTGVNGFIGSHIAKNLLSLGYHVRELNPSGHFEVVAVTDVTAPDAWSKVVKGVDGIVHVATDMSFDADPNKVITPMVQGVRNLLEAAASEPTVKRFVFTSSDRAISNVINGKEVSLDSRMWNDSAVENAWRPPPYEADRFWDVYAALKTQSEQEIWAFEKAEKPKFIINSVLPCFNIGPILHPKQPGSTGKWVRDFWRDPGHYKDLQQFGASWYISVEDTALLHIAALTQEDVERERLLGFAGPFNLNSWLHVFRQLDPAKPWPADDPSQEHNLCKVATRREVELLKRFRRSGWTSFYESVRQNCLESRE
ncbi:Epimerase domain-containing protein [Fusarium sp. LHS14.1]|nr:Epimerase domain-containing protein [Fusarium sp. LHS14.1]